MTFGMIKEGLRISSTAPLQKKKDRGLEWATVAWIILFETFRRRWSTLPWCFATTSRTDNSYCS